MIREIRYKGQIIDPRDIEMIWYDHMGNELKGDLDDFGCSRAEDAVEEHEAGEGW